MEVFLRYEAVLKWQGCSQALGAHGIGFGSEQGMRDNMCKTNLIRVDEDRLVIEGEFDTGIAFKQFRRIETQLEHFLLAAQEQFNVRFPGFRCQ